MHFLCFYQLFWHACPIKPANLGFVFSVPLQPAYLVQFSISAQHVNNKEIEVTLIRIGVLDGCFKPGLIQRHNVNLILEAQLCVTAIGN